MKRKIFALVLAATVAATCTLSLSACAHKHKFGELFIETPATCEDTGEGFRICKSCGEKSTAIIASLGHSMQKVSAKSPTCIEDGYEEYEACIRCGHSTHKRIIPATGVHVFGEDDRCVVCGKAKTVYHYVISEDGTYCTFAGIDDYDGTEYNILSEFEGVPVTTIGEYALSNATVTSVTIPGSITTISAHAFNGSAVTSLTIPDSVTRIGEYAFSGSAIKSVVLPDKITKIEKYLFDGSKIESVTIPEGVTEIAECAFAECENLKNVSIPGTIKTIDGGAFEYSENIIFNKNTEGTASFLGNESNPLLVLIKADESVESFDIDEHTKIIYGGAFDGCINLKSIEIPETVIELGSSFTGCESLESVILPDNLQKINSSTFGGCINLFNVNIPKSVTYIGDGAFAYTALQSVTIPQAAKYIGDSAFEGSALTEVTFEVNGVCSYIGNNAFSYCTQLEHFVFPEGITEIMFNTFSYCEKLEWVYIPDSLVKMQSNVFIGCDQFKYIFYDGETSEQWASVTLPASEKENLTQKVYLHSENTPTSEGQYWRWGGSLPEIR